MKRLLILAILSATVAVSGGAHAACVGTRNIASLKSGAIEVSVVARTTNACDDASAQATGPLAAPTTLTITNGTASCSIETTSDWDPFGFGAGIHGFAGPDGTPGNEDDVWSQTVCNIDISWSGFLSPYAPATDRTDGAFLGKDAAVETGLLVINGDVAPVSGSGRMYTGLGADL
jgi:hypothetical protein